MQDKTEASRVEFYRELAKNLSYLTEGEPFVLSNLSNTAALLWQHLTDINWVGFYLLKDKTLHLGPFQGKPACLRIALGQGVCGTAAEKRTAQIVADVHLFPGHIACDSLSKSELVLPIFADGKVVGVLDIDSPTLNRFDEEDCRGLQQVVHILEKACRWSTFYVG